MTTITNFGLAAPGDGTRTGTTAKTPMPPDPSCQPCPDCGGLQCLCRPRFFAGQILSEKDLNLLDRYITEKNKLHNRHLFGSGVVCGLEVKCAPCDSGFVNVSDGYALSPCGEDIVVCKPDHVDICALIARCRVDTEPDCRPYAAQGDCGDVVENWILAIRYAESPSRGITPLVGSGQSCGCGSGGKTSCGGSGSCGCGGSSCSCGSATASTAAPAATSPRLNRGSPPSCEPTVTCEAYRYDVYRVPDDIEQKPRGEQSSVSDTGMAGVLGALEGEMMHRIACCVKQLQEAIPAAPGNIGAGIAASQRTIWFQWGCQTRTALANYIARTGSTNCQSIAALQAIVIPAPTQPVAAFTAAMTLAAQQLALIMFELMIGCVCSNALPPCPPAGDPRVPLALIKVRRGDCTVISVCNWTPQRRQVLTFPTLRYWLGWIPLGRLIEQAMHKLCCEMLGLPERLASVAGDQTHQAAPAPPAPAAPAPQPGVAQPAPQGQQDGIPLHIDATQGQYDPIQPGFDTTPFEAVFARARGSDGVIPAADLIDAMMQRQRVTIDPELHGTDRLASLAKVAATGPFALLGGLAQPGVAFASRLGEPLLPQQSARDVHALSAKLDAHASEIAALKQQLAALKPAAPARRRKG
uniref:hypothetical protein n=1 Tax=uncultured Sphingomonas sp. TaxID=158754 RepID=UPI0035CA4813